MKQTKPITAIVLVILLMAPLVFSEEQSSVITSFSAKSSSGAFGKITLSPASNEASNQISYAIRTPLLLEGGLIYSTHGNGCKSKDDCGNSTTCKRPGDAGNYDLCCLPTECATSDGCVQAGSVLNASSIATAQKYCRGGEWSAQPACQDTCTPNTSECNDNGRRTCVRNSLGCFDWQWSACPQGQTCANNTCLPYTNCQQRYGKGFWCARVGEYQQQCPFGADVHEDTPGCDSHSSAYGYCVRCLPGNNTSGQNNTNHSSGQNNTNQQNNTNHSSGQNNTNQQNNANQSSGNNTSNTSKSAKPGMPCSSALPCDSNRTCKTKGDYPQNGSLCCGSGDCASSDGCVGPGAVIFQGTPQQAYCRGGAWVARPVELCNDSDGGVNPNVKGYVNRIGYGWDYCKDNNTLMETDCGGGQGGRIQTVSCQYGCNKGACRQTPPSTSVVCQQNKTKEFHRPTALTPLTLDGEYPACDASYCTNQGLMFDSCDAIMIGRSRSYSITCMQPCNPKLCFPDTYISCQSDLRGHWIFARMYYSEICNYQFTTACMADASCPAGSSQMQVNEC